VKIFKVIIVVAFLVGLIVISAKNEEKWQPSFKYMFETRDNWKFWVVALNGCITHLELGADQFSIQQFSQQAVTEENLKKYKSLYRALYRNLNDRGIGSRTLDEVETTAKELASSDGFDEDVMSNCMSGLPKLLFPKEDYVEVFKPGR